MSPPATVTAEALHARAVEHYAAGHARQARTAARRALAAAAPDAAELRSRIQITLALSTVETDGVEAGLAVLAEAQRGIEHAGDPALRVLLGSQRGALALRAGDFGLAADEYGAVLPLARHVGPVDRGVILANAATALLYLGRLAEARRYFDQAVALARRHDLPRQEAMALHNQGYVSFLAGDLPAALQLMAAAAAVGTDNGRGVALLDRARVLAEAGLVRDADACLAEAAEIFRGDGLAHFLGETEIERSRVALLGGDVAAARRFAARARDRFRRRDNPRWRRAAELVLLQADLAAHRPPSRVAQAALRLRAEFEAAGLAAAAHTAALIAAEATAERDPAGAAVLLTSAGRPRRGDPVTARLHHAHVRALVDSARGRRAGAVRRVGAALQELADYQASFGSVEMRAAAAVHGRRLALLDIALARRTGRVEAVFAAAERARAATTRLPAVRPPDDPAAAELLAELRQTIESLRAVEFDRAAAAPLQRRRQELERAILARTWTHHGGGAAARVATMDDVAAALARRAETMIMYVQADDVLSVVVVDDRPRWAPLGPARPVVEAVRRVRADLDVLASPQLRGPIRGAVRSSLERNLRELDSALLAPLGRPAGPLVIVSTGVLGQLPWGSLPSLRGVPVVVAPSATRWLGSADRHPRRTRVVALAGPDLARGDDEAAAVAASWAEARAVTGAERADLTAALTAADLLHVAAHGVHQSENPLFSSVRLADGPVFAHELAGRAPGHVVLSACEVGLATIRPGDEPLGLASVLLQLGTGSVVAGVARVNDDQAARVMVEYHRRLAGGADSAGALAAALQHGDDDLVAPFVCFGGAWSTGGFGAGATARVP